MNSKKIVWFFFVVIVMTIAVIPFLRAWDYGIINLDDYSYLTTHPSICKWTGFGSIAHAFTDVHEGIWMPLTWLSYALDFAIFGKWFGGFHIHSILIHLINSVLVYWLLAEIFATMPRHNRSETTHKTVCLLAALVWAIHPLRCESVVFLASRKDVLSFFWELLALLCWIKGGVLRTVLATAFFIVGAMCKPSVMTFPVLCFLLDAFVKREVKLPRYVAPVLFAVFLGAFAGWQQKMGGATVDDFNQPLWGRALGACAAFGIYLRNFVWPQWLAPQCTKTWPSLPRFWLPGLIISTMWGWYLIRRALRYWERRKECIDVEYLAGELPVQLTMKDAPDPLFAGCAWFAVAIAPMLGLVSFGYHAFADRFTYIPSVGLSVILVFAIEALLCRLGRLPVFTLCGAAIIALAGCTWRQTGFWRNDYDLFTHTLEVDGNHNTNAHTILGAWHYEFPHDLESCIREYELAIQQDLSFVMPNFEIYVLALCELGRANEVTDKLHLYETEMERLFGLDRARQIMSSAPDMTSKEYTIRNVYLGCKVALWLYTDGDLTNVKEVLKAVNPDVAENDALWILLRKKYAERTGNLKEAQRLADRLTDKSTDKIGYIRCRYLEKDPAH